MNCAIGHNTTIKKYSSLAPGVNFAGFTYVDPFVEVGIGVSTVQQIKIGEGSIIGGQTMLVKDVPDGATVVGNPGRVLWKGDGVKVRLGDGVIERWWSDNSNSL